MPLQINRKTTRPIRVGDVPVGGGAMVSVQSMTNTFTQDVEATVAQIKRLEAAGCEIIRCAVPDMGAAQALRSIKEQISIPLIADIHFDHKLAVASAENGADGLRINPGNIGSQDKVREVVQAARDHGMVIRIGVNAGSLEKDLLKKYGAPTAEAMVESAVNHIDMVRSWDFHDIKVSIKASDVFKTIEAYRALSEKTDLPLHLGITEAGTRYAGTVKSSLGIGLLLFDGIGDTIRVSLTGDPVTEVRVAYEILRSLKIRERGPEIISCPTCGRTEIDVLAIVDQVEKRLQNMTKPMKIAIMGCVVNGPGEAREADVGIAGGRGVGIVFRRGQVIRKVKEAELVEALLEEIGKDE
ncbi:1-hydroxy-2-methyl-2-(E)-butenyl 4-diphosphate synthase [Desulfatibacillum aliphaticivorans]|uniref:4-hydroxy-3-methylbut-2-en-1-yl diphosphate synthase (flavodoxin) n=1 Tax=Desulfatibacillum aliphaticivorans TaxID=218208 RepID=B8FDZ5_DESAL|nr:flavodoxin-dependent (E)-4-hydroxy-3-methylbut-2-enyl-diphosphate synthase [Desulfatibacillum aliphaticivorans]ACL06776.1 1-hydroxy-2-methyl-2-(E)-butenyl 4-diphosphate synthase [Desulfatibacillum aliphaticivorans]